MQAAAQVFARHGYAAGTTNRIADRAGVSIGTLYQYFPNKDAILIALIERHIQEGEELLRPLLSDLVEHPPRPATHCNASSAHCSSCTFASRRFTVSYSRRPRGRDAYWTTSPTSSTSPAPLSPTTSTPDPRSQCQTHNSQHNS